MSASTQTAKKNPHPSSSKQGQSVPNSYQQLRNRCPGCHVDVHMEKRARETTVDPDQRQHHQFTDCYIGASTLQRDRTMIGGRPDTPEAERILPMLTRSDPVATRTLMPIGTEGESPLSRRKKVACDSERSSPPYKSTLESALRAEGEMPTDTGAFIDVSASSSSSPPITSAITDSIERNDVDMVQANVNNEGQKSTDTMTPKDTRQAPISVATEEVTPLLGGSPRLDHHDLDPLHRVRDRPEYKYSKLSLQMPTAPNAAANAQGEGIGGSEALGAGENAAAAGDSDGSRAEGVEESPAPSPVPTLERRKTELVWRS